MKDFVVSTSRSLAVRAGDVLGQLTHAQRVPPTFLIVGAQRCGTTALFKTLMQHPRVFGPRLRKGVHYFDIHPDHPASWYRSHFPTQSTINRAALSGSAVHVGESSPYYLWHPLAAERINAMLPEVRLLVLLRDPVERAYSAHSHELARGFETEPFEQALELEPQRLNGESQRLQADPHARSPSHQHHAYVARGEYIDQLERVAAVVGRERMMVLDSQDFWTTPELVWPELTTFLSLTPASVTFERHNARSRSPMSDSVRRSLNAHFLPYDERLAAWWGRTPAWRR